MTINILFFTIFLVFTISSDLFPQEASKMTVSEELRKQTQMERQKQRVIEEYLQKNRVDYCNALKAISERIQKEHNSTYLTPYMSYKDEAMLSELVITGQVVNIEYNTKGPYHTWVTVRIDSRIKGRENKDAVVVKLVSGPIDSVGGRFKTSLEPQFTIGERLILFLSTIPKNLWFRGGPVSEAPGYRFPKGKRYASFLTYYFDKYKIVPDGYEPQKKIEITDNKVSVPTDGRHIDEFIKDEFSEINTQY